MFFLFCFISNFFIFFLQQKRVRLYFGIEIRSVLFLLAVRGRHNTTMQITHPHDRHNMRSRRSHDDNKHEENAGDVQIQQQHPELFSPSNMFKNYAHHQLNSLLFYLRAKAQMQSKEMYGTSGVTWATAAQLTTFCVHFEDSRKRLQAEYLLGSATTRGGADPESVFAIELTKRAQAVPVIFIAEPSAETRGSAMRENWLTCWAQNRPRSPLHHLFVTLANEALVHDVPDNVFDTVFYSLVMNAHKALCLSEPYGMRTHEDPSADLVFYLVNMTVASSDDENAWLGATGRQEQHQVEEEETSCEAKLLQLMQEMATQVQQINANSKETRIIAKHQLGLLQQLENGVFLLQGMRGGDENLPNDMRDDDKQANDGNSTRNALPASPMSEVPDALHVCDRACTPQSDAGPLSPQQLYNIYTPPESLAASPRRHHSASKTTITTDRASRFVVEQKEEAQFPPLRLAETERKQPTVTAWKCVEPVTILKRPPPQQEACQEQQQPSEAQSVARGYCYARGAKKGQVITRGGYTSATRVVRVATRAESASRHNNNPRPETPPKPQREVLHQRMLEDEKEREKKKLSKAAKRRQRAAKIAAEALV